MHGTRLAEPGSAADLLRQSNLRIAIFCAALLVPTHSAAELINNGLDEQSPANVIDRVIDDFLFVRNTGCPPQGNDWDPCPEPGDATTVQVVEGARIVNDLRVYDTSSILMTGGEVDDLLWAHDSGSLHVTGGSVGFVVKLEESSSATLEGGTFGADVDVLESSHLDLLGGTFANHVYVAGDATASIEGGDIANDLLLRDRAVVTWSGGAVGGALEAAGTSLLRIEGTGFAVDGAPVSEGDLLATTGTLTGTLRTRSGASQPIENAFRQGGADCSPGDCTGTITLIDVPEPNAPDSRGIALATMLVLCIRIRHRAIAAAG